MVGVDTLQLILGASNVAVALLLIGVSLPLLRGRIKPNRTYGFRFPQRLESEEAWFAINRYGARRMVIWSLPLLVLGMATFFLPATPSVGAIVAIANAPLVAVVPSVETWVFARRFRSEG